MEEVEEFNPDEDFVFRTDINFYEVTKKIPLGFWDNRQNVWKWLAYLVQNFETEAALYLLDLDRGMSIGFSNAPWHWYVLSQPEIFDLPTVALLFKWTMNKFAFDAHGVKVPVPLQISIKPVEVFQFLLHLYGEGLEDAFIRAEQAFELIRGEPFDITFYQRLREIQFNQDPDGREYTLDDLLVSRIVARNDFAPMPNYLIVRPSISNLTETVFNESTIDYETPLTMEEASREIRDYVVGRPGELERYRREYSLAKFRQGLEKSPELCRVFGPVNRMANADLTKEDICSRYGGCRMFVCPHGQGGRDWFLGFCQACLRKIRFSSCAVRRPKIGGGWTGCFCNFEHLKKDTRDNLWEPDNDDLIDQSLTLDEIEVRKDAAAVLPLKIIDTVEKIINKNGIYSPLDPEKAKSLPDLEKPIGIFENF